MFKIVVVVRTAVIPKAILAGMTSFRMKKLIQESITIIAHGAYRWRKKYSYLRSRVKTNFKPDQFPRNR